MSPGVPPEIPFVDRKLCWGCDAPHYKEGRWGKFCSLKCFVDRALKMSGTRIIVVPENAEDFLDFMALIELGREADDRHDRVKRHLQNNLSALARRRGQGKVVSRKDVWGRLGCSSEQFVAWIESNFTTGMSWQNYGTIGWQLDHVVPCSLFDLSREDHQWLCFHWKNFRPLWASENYGRGNRWTPQDLDWLCPDYLARVRAAGVDV